MIAVGVMQPAVYQVVEMVAVRHGLVAAAGTVLVTVATVLRSAAHGVQIADLDHVLIDMPLMGMNQMAILKVIDMVPVADREMAAVRAMPMGYGGRAGHACFPSQIGGDLR